MDIALNRAMDAITLGLMSPLTGLVEMYGQEISWAAQVAVNEINESGGVLGRPLKLVILDDGSLPETALPAARRLIEEYNCTAIIGNLLSNSRIAVANKVAEPERVPYLNFSFYEGSILSRYFFHFAALPNQQIDKMIPYMANRFGRKMFFAGSNYEWPRGSIDAAKIALLNAGGEILGEEYLPIGTEDVEALLDQLERSGADVLVPYFAGADQINLLTRFTERGLKNRMKVVMGHYDEAMVSRLRPEIREGFYSSNTYFMSVDTPENKRYMENLQKLEDVDGLWPEGNGLLTNFGEGVYLCVHAFAEAAKQAGTVEREALVDALETVTISGPQGRVVMDPLTHHARVNTHLTRCNRDGTFEFVSSFGRMAPVIPERYAGNIEKIDQGKSELMSKNGHDGSSGYAMVDNNGRFMYASKSFSFLTGIHQIESGNRNLLTILKNAKRSSFDEHMTSLFDQGTRASEYIRDMDGDDEQSRLLCISILKPELRKQHSSGYFMVTCKVSPPNPLRFNQPSYFTQPVAPKRSGVNDSDILNMADIGLISINGEGEIVQVNKYTCKLFGYEYYEMIGMSVHLLLPPQFRERHKKYVTEFYQSSAQEISMGQRGEIAGYRKDGSIFPAEGSISKTETKDGWVMTATIRDKTVQMDYEKRLIHTATHDSLTGLANRLLINERLANALKRGQIVKSTLGLLFLDMDEFKLINDSYGHDVGDELLVEIGRRLLAVVRPGDTVARFGGDEFVILCDNLPDIEALEALADKVVQALKQPVYLRDEEIIITGSLGATVSVCGNLTPRELLRNADTAMYTAKSNGKNSWSWFDAKARSQARIRLQVGSGLRMALERNELELRLHPIVDSRTGELTGAETLMRWFPSSGEVSPGVFIPIAEKYGSVYELGFWIFNETCKNLARWKREKRFESLNYVSVNVSARQLSQKKIVDEFAQVLEQTGVDPNRILLEITETALMNDMDAEMNTLNELAKLGLRVAVDDFGTGYSSLSQLAQMPVSYLKIDRAFISNLIDNQKIQDIVSAVIDMAHAMKLKVIAEGVETREQKALLESLKCDSNQGYLYSKPLSLNDFELAY